jgi:hypothetical protein
MGSLCQEAEPVLKANLLKQHGCSWHLCVLQGQSSSAVDLVFFEFHAAAAAFAIEQPSPLSVCLLLDRRSVTCSIFFR